MDAKEIQENLLSWEETRDMALHRFRSSNTVTMSPELFEKLYLQPMGSVKGDLRKTFGNPTPLGLIGFAVALTPLACCLMGWRGSGSLGAANMWADLRFKVSEYLGANFTPSGIFYFIGGPLQIFCGILEFFLGNTFPFAVFTSYGE